jgi:hypothetical protein
MKTWTTKHYASLNRWHVIFHEGKSCTKFLNQYSFICSKFYKLYKYNINISHNKTTGRDTYFDVIEDRMSEVRKKRHLEIRKNENKRRKYI